MSEIQKKKKQIQEKIKTHAAMLDSLHSELKRLENDKNNNPAKEAWLKAVLYITNPFARFNKSAKQQIADPELFDLLKDINKLQDLIIKVLNNPQKLKSQKAIEKTQKKLQVIKDKILANPAYISQRYSDSMNVKETLEEWQNADTFLSGMKDIFHIQALSVTGANTNLDQSVTS